MSRFDGMTVMITGAARGFGAMAARRFAAEGAKVALGDVIEDVFAVAEEVGGRAIRCDVSKEDDVKALVALATELGDGRLDVGLNNAGIVHSLGKLEDVTLDTFNRQMSVNAGGVFLCMKHQLPVMTTQGGG
ncbi:MAG: SDR family oxidoreductase, partial [Pseudomonadota bacterium]